MVRLHPSPPCLSSSRHPVASAYLGGDVVIRDLLQIILAVRKKGR